MDNFTKTLPVVQCVVSLIADPRAVSSIAAEPCTLVEIDCVIFSTLILLLLPIQDGLLLVTSESMCTKYC